MTRVFGRVRLHRLRKKPGFVSGHRFSDAANPRNQTSVENAVGVRQVERRPQSNSGVSARLEPSAESSARRGRGGRRAVPVAFRNLARSQERRPLLRAQAAGCAVARRPPTVQEYPLPNFHPRPPHPPPPPQTSPP